MFGSSEYQTHMMLCKLALILISYQCVFQGSLTCPPERFVIPHRNKCKYEVCDFSQYTKLDITSMHRSQVPQGSLTTLFIGPVYELIDPSDKDVKLSRSNILVVHC